MNVRLMGCAVVLLAAATVSLIAAGNANAEVIRNGNFSVNGGPGQLTFNTTVADWTGGGREGIFGDPNRAPVFLFTPGTTAQLQTTGVNGSPFMGNIRFWSATAAPGGGNIIAADGDSTYMGSLRQTVTGLTPGTSYRLTFNWAGAQQFGFDGPTTERWQVSFGADTRSTPTVSIPNHGFSGWQSASMDFTATNSSQLLNFLAVGTPNGQPPWLLLNSVSMNEAGGSPVPEPSSMMISTICIGGLLLYRRHKKAQIRRLVG